MSNTELEKFDPNKIMDTVRDRIKASFVNLIPEEHWQGLVKKEIDNFFAQKERQPQGYGRNEYRSDFGLLVTKLLNEEVDKRIKECLCSEEFTVTWENFGKPVVSKAIKETLVENSQAIFMNTIGAMMQNVLSQMQMQNPGQY